MNWVHKIFGKKLYSEITVSELCVLSDDVRRIDVREPDEFGGELGHLRGAELVPLKALTDIARSWDCGTPFLIVCRSGARSAQACQILTDMGFENVTNLKGGMLAVRAAGL